MISAVMKRSRAHSPSKGDPNVLIAIVSSAATGFVVATGGDAVSRVAGAPVHFVAFLVLTVALQLVAVEVYNRGSISFAGTGLLALGFTFGTGAAMVTAFLMGIINLVARRGKLNRGVFDAAQFALAAGAGTAVYQFLDSTTLSLPERGLLAFAASAVYLVVNITLLCFAMSLAEGVSAVSIWKERYSWFTPYHLASGPLALALTYAYEQVGPIGLLAFAVPPAMMTFSVRQYLNRTRVMVEEVRHANGELERRNAELRDLFDFAGGLAARAHDQNGLVEYVQRALARMTGAPATVSFDPEGGPIPLQAGTSRVGSIALAESSTFDSERWDRLRDAVLPHVATALESSALIDRVRRQHLATIAALSKSMEAKDYYTGGHTERVAEVAVALARKLAYRGEDLDAIEIGALLHDIGKIGIPERILQKPGPLDEDEWKVMKEHPVISEYILSEVGLPEIVLQIARSSHERMDGAGYPDGKMGENIPLPARIVLVADAFDALTSDRPYRRGRHAAAAIEELRAHAGTQFCPRVIKALERLYWEEPQLLGVGQARTAEVA